MEDKIRARIETLEAEMAQAREKLQAAHNAVAEYTRYLHAATGAVEALQDLLKPEAE